MTSGIYTITNLVNGKMYVGYTTNFKSRWRGHRWSLRKGIKSNDYLQKAWNKYGEESFLFEVLVECEEQFLASEENYWCNMLDTHNRKYVYNILQTDNNRRPKHSKESKEKISKSNLGRVISQETRDKISAGNRGHTAYNRGVPMSAETKSKVSNAKMGRSVNKGRVFSEETKRKMSLARIGRPPVNKGILMSPKQLIKMINSLRGRSVWNKGVPMSKEQKIKVSEGRVGIQAWNKGKKLTEEHKKNLRKPKCKKVLS